MHIAYKKWKCWLKYPVPLWEHRAASRRYGERHQRCPALNHMCNQSKLTARRQVRVTSWPGCLKARDVQPVPAFCHSAKLSVCVSRLCSVSLLLSRQEIRKFILKKIGKERLEADISKANEGESRSHYRLCVPPCPRAGYKQFLRCSGWEAKTLFEEGVFTCVLAAPATLPLRRSSGCARRWIRWKD